METITEKLMQQLLYFADVVNEFKSETVQLKVTERLLNHLVQQNKESESMTTPVLEATSYVFSGENKIPQIKKPKMGHTKAVQSLLGIGFFDTPKAIADVAVYCNNNYDGTYQTNQFSGILLALVKETTLSRSISHETNRYQYQKLQSA